jgi:hypothetical protein
MSLEDQYHSTYSDNNQLIARFEVNNHYIKTIRDNIKSDRFNNVLNLISEYNNYSEIYTSDDVLNCEHPDIKVNFYNSIIEFNINHSKIGGSILVRLIESIINSKPRIVPKTNLLQGILYTLYDIKTLYNLNNAPCNPIYTDKLSHYTKKYSIIDNFNISRLTQTYYDLFMDAITALSKPTIKIALTIPFEYDNIINNIGIIIIDFNKNMNIDTLDNLLKNNIHLAYITNTLNVYGKSLANILKTDNYKLRSKIDIVCSTFISDNTAIPGDFSFQPTKNIVEGAYISLYIRLLGSHNRKEATAYAAVTTNNSKQKWNNVKFIKYK